MSGDAPRKAWLILEDGSVVVGEAFGAAGTAYGELVFNTGMTGYQESLTDPSYNGQVLMFTYPMVGNYGVNGQDVESDRVWPRAVVVREWCRQPSHRLATQTLHEWLQAEGVPGISGVDTRALTLKTREKGCLRCFVTHDAGEVEALRARVADMPSVEADNLAGQASVEALRRYGRNEAGDLVDAGRGAADGGDPRPGDDNHPDDGRPDDGRPGDDAHPLDGDAYTVAVIDTGIKRNILRNLVRRFNVLHFPWDATADEVLAERPDALFLANGPGDPGHPDILDQTVPAIRALSEALPTFGICYGNQLISRAWGATTSKMKFGHRGANIPVREEATHHVRITSQNHGFAVDAGSVEGTGLVVWETCPNDGCVEALRHEALPVFTTQYHPEACPGPWDSGHLFDSFHRLVDDVKQGRWRPGDHPLLQGRGVGPVPLAAPGVPLETRPGGKEGRPDA